MTQRQITARIKKIQKAEFEGRITHQEMAALIAGLAAEMKNAGL